VGYFLKSVMLVDRNFNDQFIYGKSFIRTRDTALSQTDYVLDDRGLFPGEGKGPFF
jgi:hypothetical protein